MIKKLTNLPSRAWYNVQAQGRLGWRKRSFNLKSIARLQVGPSIHGIMALFILALTACQDMEDGGSRTVIGCRKTPVDDFPNWTSNTPNAHEPTFCQQTIFRRPHFLPAPVLTASHISHHRTAGQKLLLRNPRIATKSSPDSSSTERPRSIEYVETLGEIRQHPRKKVVENTIDIGCATNIEAQRLDHHRSTRGFTHGHYSCKFTPECGRHERRNEE